jgi:hypothetical protein
LIVCACALVVSSLVATAQPELLQQGMLRVQVRFKDGTPAAGLPLRITVPPFRQEFILDANGVFVGMVPMGAATLDVSGVPQTPVLVTLDGVAQVELTIQTPAVVVNVVGEDGGPVAARPIGWCKSPARPTDRLKPTRVTPTVYWFTGVPADATEFGVSVDLGGVGASGALQKTWTGAEVRGGQRLVVTVPKPVPVTLTFVDRAGAALANARVTLTVGGDWLGGRREAPLSVVTDAVGRASLGVWLPRRYTIVAAGVGEVTDTTSLEVRADGTLSTDRIVVATSMRTITQTVFGSDGKPAANAVVQASYCWHGRMELLTARSDAAGCVTWREVPPVRMITWGSEVPAAVVPAAGGTFAAPLPAPTVVKPVPVRVALPDLGDQPVPYTWVWQTGTSARTTGNDATHRPGDAAHDLLPAAYPGRRFSLVLVARTSPARLAVFDDVYLPYDDTLAGITLAPEWRECPSVRGRFVTVGNTQVLGVSRLDVVPVAMPDPLPLLVDQRLEDLGFLTPVGALDGTFTVSLPGPGAYRLLVDTIDESTPAPPSLVFTVAEGAREVTFTLPAPIALAPAGAEVHWLTRNAPGAAHTLTVAAHAPMMPVFGVREALVAVWHRATPATIALRPLLRPGQPEQTLQLRRVVLRPVDTNGVASLDAFRLLAPLPDAGADTSVLLKRQPAYDLDLWSGAQLLAGPDYPVNRRLGVCAIPATGATEFVVPLAAITLGVAPAATRRVMVEVPVVAAGGKGRNTASLLVYADDGATPVSMIPYYMLRGTLALDLPAATRAVRLVWPGTGATRDLPLPPAAKGDASLRVAAWEPGRVLSGAIIDTAGQIMPNAAMVMAPAALPRTAGYVRIEADEQGRFRVPGWPPGQVLVSAQQMSGTWIVALGEEQTDVALRRSKTVLRIDDATYAETAVAWWMPTDGNPVRIPAAAMRDVAGVSAGDGRLWWIDGSAGRASLQRLMLIAGVNAVRPRNAGPSLGIIVSMAPGDALPGPVTLIGQGPLVGITARFATPRWLPSAALGLVTMTVDAVPPGAYTVTVETARGPLEGTATVADGGGHVILTPAKE